MNWYLTAIVAALGYSGQMLGMQRLQKSYPIPVYLTYIWLGAGLVIGLIFTRSIDFLNLETGLLLLAAAAGSWVGMYGVNKAIQLQPNIGYVTAVSSLQMGLIYGISLLYFGAVPDVVRLLAVAGVAVGALLVVGFRGEKGASSDRRWVLWVLSSTLCFTLLFATVRMLTNHGVDARTTTSLVMLLAGLAYAGSSVVGGMSLKPKGALWVIGLTILFSVIGNAAFFSSLAVAPNMAYTAAISNSQIIILYLAALLIGTGKLEPSKAVGVLLTFGCVLLLA